MAAEPIYADTAVPKPDPAAVDPMRALPDGAVDSHAHVLKKDAPLAAIRHSAPARDVSVEDYLDTLDTHHVSLGILTAPSFYGTDNSLLLEALSKARGRLRGTAIVDPDIAPDALQSMNEKGVCGIRLNWVKRSALPDVSSTQYQRLFGLIRELDMHVEVYIEGELLPPVLACIQRSGAKAVVDHFGSPDPSRGTQSEGFKYLLGAIGAGKTWVKLSAPYRMGGVDVQPYVNQLLKECNGERTVWATDWPWVGFEDDVTYRQCVDWLFDWVPDDKLRHSILVDTPQHLFGFQAQPAAPL